MKTLIIYDSRYGNTEKLAQAMERVLAAKHEVKLVKANDFTSEQMQNVELLIVGSPTYGGRPSPAIKEVLEKFKSLDIKGVKGIAFDTGMPAEEQHFFLKGIIKFFGYASPRIANALKAEGVTMLGNKTFYVLGEKGPLKQGESESVETWLKTLLA